MPSVNDTTNSLSVLDLLAGLKERRPKQGAPECPKEIEEMNTCAKVFNSNC